MSRVLRNRLARLEGQAAARRTLIVLARDWRRMTPDRRAELEQDPSVHVLVIETGIEREAAPCVA